MQRPPMTAAKRAARDAGATAREAATHPWTVRLARCGYATKGVIYLLVGTLAARAAFGRGGETTDNRGAIATLYQQPFGRFLVALVALGLFAYALWLFVAAALDPERKGSDAKGAATRVGSAALGCSYAALGVVAAKLVLQRGGGPELGPGDPRLDRPPARPPLRRGAGRADRPGGAGRGGLLLLAGGDRPFPR